MSTKDLVRAARMQNPRQRTSVIARTLGVSRQAVHKALIALGLPTKVDGAMPRLNPPTRHEERDRHRYGQFLNPNKCGAICELEVCADLLKRGWDVYRTISNAAACDVVGINGERVLRFEVRAAMRKGQSLVCQSPPKDRYDVLAKVAPDGYIEYNPPIDEPPESTSSSATLDAIPSFATPPPS